REGLAVVADHVKADVEARTLRAPHERMRVVTDDLPTRTPEDMLGRCVAVLDRAGGIEHDYPVGRGGQYRAQTRFLCPQAPEHLVVTQGAVGAHDEHRER